MSSSKLPVWLIATMMLLSMGFVLYPQGSANAARYCAQLRGATAEGHPDCSFSTLDKCRARVRHRGGGHCSRSHEVGCRGMSAHAFPETMGYRKFRLTQSRQSARGAAAVRRRTGGKGWRYRRQS